MTMTTSDEPWKMKDEYEDKNEDKGDLDIAAVGVGAAAAIVFTTVVKKGTPFQVQNLMGQVISVHHDAKSRTPDTLKCLTWKFCFGRWRQVEKWRCESW